MLSVDEVKNIAKLARIGLSDEDVPKYQKDLSAILDFFQGIGDRADRWGASDGKYYWQIGCDARGCCFVGKRCRARCFSCEYARGERWIRESEISVLKI
jgi:hypothetical protein